MIRWVSFSVCAIVGLLMLWCGLRMPVHLRAVDAIVLQKAGKSTPSLVDGGLSLVNSRQLGAAQLFLAGARDAQLARSEQLSEAVSSLASSQPTLRFFGSAEADSLRKLFKSPAHTVTPGTNRTLSNPEAFTGFIIQADNRSKALELLQASTNPLSQALIQFRSVTNTVLFPSSSSASGQALDAAISLCGLLVESGHLSADFSNSVLRLAVNSRQNQNPQPLEEVLMDLISLGQRFNWGQLAKFVEQIHDPETLRLLSNLLQKDEKVPAIYSAVCLTDNAAGVAKYLTTFGETGLSDLRTSLSFGAGGVNELVQRNQQLCNSSLCVRGTAQASSGAISAFAVDFSRQNPPMALAVKWLMYFIGGFLLAAAFHFARHVTVLEKPLEVRGFHIIREVLFALVILIVVLFLSEPFLSQGSQKVELPFRLRLPMVGSAGPAGNAGVPTTIMNQVTFLTMLLFFVLQALLYVASLVKLAEIRRQRVAARVKLKLLENEDHLFDAGLYLGFLGTIISLILVSLGVFKQPSLMAAYSATSFGILFVVLFKVLHLRPARRHLLMEAEIEPIHVPTGTQTTLAAPL